ncbi:hypothetical protein ACRV2W_004676, partial [Vibrio alginolyticus]
NRKIMSTNYKKEINQAITLLERFVKTRISLKISYGLMAAGLSILGFNNLVPYILIAVEPTLKDVVVAQNDIYTAIAIILIVLGALSPIFVQIFEYYKSLYIKDLEKINLVRSKHTLDSFRSTIEYISTNLAITDFQNDRIEELCSLILNLDFRFQNKVLNSKAKLFASELENFNSMLSMKLDYAPTGRVSVLPRERKRDDVIQGIRTDCTKVFELYNSLFEEIERMENKGLMRFFA